MIDNININNFKSLKNVSVQPKNLNILMGLNGMGKSSFIQVLLLLIQSDKIIDNYIELNGSLVDVGVGKDILYQFAKDDLIKFSISFCNGTDISWDFIYEKDKDKLQSKAVLSPEQINNFKRQTSNFQYIAAERVGPEDFYDVSNVIVSDKKHIGLNGEFSAYYLNLFGSSHVVPENMRISTSSDKLLEQTNAWLSKISPNIKLNTKYIPEINKVVLDYQFALLHGQTNSFKPKNVGFGITYVIPVILSLLTSERGKIIIIENPESHIHPRGQAELGNLIALAAANGAQLFIETHSDHILNGIRVAVKQQNIIEHEVNIMYFDKITTENEQYTNINFIEIDKRGELSEYPKDFLDEWNNQLIKLI